MAYADSGLRKLSSNLSAGGASVFHYATNDTADVCAGSGYFNSAADKVRKDDIIFVSADLDGTPAHARFVVSAVTSSSVTVTGWSAAAAQAALVTTPATTDIATAVNALRGILIAHGMMKGAS